MSLQSRRACKILVFINLYFCTDEQTTSLRIYLKTEVRKCLVGLSHPMRIFPLLDGGTLVAGSIHQFASQTCSHITAAAFTCILNEPAHCQRLPASHTYFHGDLISSTTDTSRLDFDQRRGVLERILKDLETRPLRALLNQSKRIVDHTRSKTFLAALHDVVDKFGDHFAVIARIRNYLA